MASCDARRPCLTASCVRHHLDFFTLAAAQELKSLPTEHYGILNGLVKGLTDICLLIFGVFSRLAFLILYSDYLLLDTLSRLYTTIFCTVLSPEIAFSLVKGGKEHALK